MRARTTVFDVSNDTSTGSSSDSSVTSIRKELARRVMQDMTSWSKATSLLTPPTNIFREDPFGDNDNIEDVAVARESTDAVV